MANVTKLAEPVGKVTHFYDHLGVAIIKLERPLRVHSHIHILGHTTDLEETVESMQFDHEPIAKAETGQEVGIKVHERVREGDQVFLDEPSAL